MVILKVVVAGAIAGVFSNVTGYLITGRLFTLSRAEPLIPGAQPSHGCITSMRLPLEPSPLSAIGFFTRSWAGSPVLCPGSDRAWRQLRCDCLGGDNTAVDTRGYSVRKLARSFAVRLLLDWLVVYVLASVSAAVVVGAV